ncbi:MAG: hemin receptor [Bacteroidetes bacterium]|nr:hemin receptor [Bacteroidota bacterium]
MFDSSSPSQSVKLVDMLSLIVARLERLDELTEEINQLAKRHVEYGVKDKHYEYVGAALIWTLHQALRNEWSAELEAAWIKCYTILADTMITAAKE